MSTFRGFLKGSGKDYVTRMGTAKSGMNVCIKAENDEVVDVYSLWNSDKKRFEFIIYVSEKSKWRIMAF